MKKRIKFVQVNIYCGKYLDGLLNFLLEMDPDIVSMQEVTKGEVNRYKDKSADTFSIISKQTKLMGVADNVLEFYDSPGSLFRNAIFSNLPIINHNIVVLKSFRPISLTDIGDHPIIKELPRHLLDVTLDLNGVTVHAISCHGAWTAPPTDTSETLRQARIIADYLESLNKQNAPFIMGADMNMPPEMETVKIIDKVARNLMLDSPFKYTTHPKVHKIAPRKLLVDYIFVSKHFEKISLDVPEVLVSDHLPVVAVLEYSV